AERRDVHDARRLAEHQKRQQNPGEQESGEVVDGEAQLVAVLAHLSSTGRAAGADAGIVDENVEPVAFLADGAGETTHTGERGKTPGKEARRAAVGGANFVEQLLAARAIAAMDQDARALIGQPTRDEPPHAVRRSGDQYGFVCNVHATKDREN